MSAHMAITSEEHQALLNRIAELEALLEAATGAQAKQRAQEEFGQRVKDARMAIGMTQADLGKRVGRTQGWVAGLEMGTRSLSYARSMGMVTKLAVALGVMSGDLDGGLEA